MRYSISILGRPKKRLKGIHAKSKMSKNKNSKNYVKPYAKQGR